MNPKNWDFAQWVNFAALAITVVAGAGWWALFLKPEYVAAISSGSVTIVTLLNLLIGKVPELPKPPAA